MTWITLRQILKNALYLQAGYKDPFLWNYLNYYFSVPFYHSSLYLLQFLQKNVVFAFSRSVSLQEMSIRKITWSHPHSVILHGLHARFGNQNNFKNVFFSDLMTESDKWKNIDSWFWRIVSFSYLRGSESVNKV